MLGSVCCVLAIAIAAGQNQGTIENDNGSLRFVVAPGKVRVQIHPRLVPVIIYSALGNVVLRRVTTL